MQKALAYAYFKHGASSETILIQLEDKTHTEQFASKKRQHISIPRKVETAHSLKVQKLAWLSLCWI